MFFCCSVCQKIAEPKRSKNNGRNLAKELRKEGLGFKMQRKLENTGQQEYQLLVNQC